jgi:hypothetical protein
MLVAMAVLMVALIAGPAANVTGKWDGTIKGQRPDGTPHEDVVLLILTQKDKTISGTVGGNENDQHPIVSGTIEGSKITILAKHSSNDREYKLELTLDGDEMKGKLTSGERTAEFVAKRRK